MTPLPFTPAARLPLAAAALLLACLGAAQAQRAGGSTTATTLWDDYIGPVEAPPVNCAISGFIIDGIPRNRPVLQKPQGSPPIVISAQVVAGVPMPLGTRQVAFAYSFTRLGQILPPYYQGVLKVDSVRTMVHSGPTAAYPLVSDRTVLGVDHVAWSDSVAQQLVSGAGASQANNTWTVRTMSTGRWSSAPFQPSTWSRVDITCSVAVKPAATPVNQ